VLGSVPNRRQNQRPLKADPPLPAWQEKASAPSAAGCQSAFSAGMPFSEAKRGLRGQAQGANGGAGQPAGFSKAKNGSFETDSAGVHAPAGRHLFKKTE